MSAILWVIVLAVPSAFLTSEREICAKLVLTTNFEQKRAFLTWERDFESFAAKSYDDATAECPMCRPSRASFAPSMGLVSIIPHTPTRAGCSGLRSYVAQTAFCRPWRLLRRPCRSNRQPRHPVRSLTCGKAAFASRPARPGAGRRAKRAPHRLA